MGPGETGYYRSIKLSKMYSPHGAAYISEYRSCTRHVLENCCLTARAQLLDDFLLKFSTVLIVTDKLN